MKEAKKKKIKTLLIKLRLLRVAQFTLNLFRKYVIERIDYRDTTYPPEFIEALKDIVKDKVVCDIGCRRGYVMKDFAKYASRVVGIEKEKTYCQICWKKGLDVVLGDIRNTAIPEADVYYLWVTDLNEYILNRLRKENRKGTLIIRLGDLKTQIIKL